MTQYPRQFGQPQDGDHGQVHPNHRVQGEAHPTQPLQLSPRAFSPRAELTPPPFTRPAVFTPPLSVTPVPGPPPVSESAPSVQPGPQPASGWRGVLEMPAELAAPAGPAAADSRQSRAIIAQYTCLILGIIWSVIGGIALARLSIGGDITNVAGMGFNVICGWGAVIVGFILTLVGAFASQDRNVLLAAATLLLVPGLVIASVPDAFATLLGATATNGVAMCATAAVLCVVAELQRSRP